MATEEKLIVGNRVRYRGGLIEGTIVDVLWLGKYYIGWDDGSYSLAMWRDVERVL